MYTCFSRDRLPNRDPQLRLLLYLSSGINLCKRANPVKSSKLMPVRPFWFPRFPIKSDIPLLKLKITSEAFLPSNQMAVIVEQNIQIFCDLAVNSGIYAFAVVKEGQPSELKARFTFVYRKIGDRWLIVDHHSSGMPEKTL